MLDICNLRLVFGLVFAAIVYATPHYFVGADGTYGWHFYAFLVVVYAFHQVCKSGLRIHAKIDMVTLISF